MLAPLTFVFCALASAPLQDTIAIPFRETPPRIDGVTQSSEYGRATLTVPTAYSGITVWLGRNAEWIYIAANIPDTTFYWGDDLVISLDPDGSGGGRVGTGDRQWYLRRVVDSSRVMTSPGGRWSQPGQEPAALGAVHRGQDWDVAVTSENRSWSVELRIRASAFSTSAAVLPRIAIRSYNDGPNGWWSWPAPPAGTPAQRVEQAPDLWTSARIR